MQPCYVYVGFLIVLVACHILENRLRAAFDGQFPPISEHEFVVRLSPGIDPAIAFKVRRILAETLNVDHERIYPTSRLTKDLLGE